MKDYVYIECYCFSTSTLYTFGRIQCCIDPPIDMWLELRVAEQFSANTFQLRIITYLNIL